MNGSNFRRCLRLLGSLARHPSHLPRYLAHSLPGSASPLEAGLPWIAWSAIDYLARTLPADATVLEYGAGGSTRFFARRAARIISIESDPGWADRVARTLVSDGLKNVELRIAPLPAAYSPEATPAAFASSKYLSSGWSANDRQPDLILIDFLDDEHLLRPVVFAFLEQHVARPGCLIVLDDAWRYPNLPHHAQEVLEFQSTGPGRPGVTTTRIYRY